MTNKPVSDVNGNRQIVAKMQIALNHIDQYVTQTLNEIAEITANGRALNPDAIHEHPHLIAAIGFLIDAYKEQGFDGIPDELVE